MGPTANQLVVSWLQDMGLNPSLCEVGPYFTKWEDVQWRISLSVDLELTGFNIWRCSHIKESLIDPTSIPKIEAWIRVNKC